GMVTKRGVAFQHAFVHHETYTRNKVSKNVVVLKAYAGMDDTLLAEIENLPVDGIVIEALRQGNLPPSTLRTLERLLTRGIPIVLVS
ncbi:asparaginase, partial [Bacillus cereus]|nr:asparaginase [Bacillus cereus]